MLINVMLTKKTCISLFQFIVVIFSVYGCKSEHEAHEELASVVGNDSVDDQAHEPLLT